MMHRRPLSRQQIDNDNIDIGNSNRSHKHNHQYVNHDHHEEVRAVGDILEKTLIFTSRSRGRQDKNREEDIIDIVSQDDHEEISKCISNNNSEIGESIKFRSSQRHNICNQRQRTRGPRARRPRSNHKDLSKDAVVNEDGASVLSKSISMKNAVMMLNELFPPPGAPQYRVVSMSGSPNNPTFEIVCSILGQSFSGSGKSKKEAKLAASQLALEKLYGKEFSSGSSGTSRDSSGNGKNCHAARSISEIDAWMELEGKNPVSILNELYPGVIFTLVSSDGPSHAPEFCVTATLENLTFQGQGNSKKEAKLHASKALLVHIHQVGFDPMTGGLKSKPDVEVIFCLSLSIPVSDL